MNQSEEGFISMVIALLALIIGIPTIICVTRCFFSYLIKVTPDTKIHVSPQPMMNTVTTVIVHNPDESYSLGLKKEGKDRQIEII